MHDTRAPRARSSWLPPLTRTLRFRMMLWNAALVILTAGATLIGLREGVRFALLHELDQMLEADLYEIGLALEEPQRPTFDDLTMELERKARGHQEQGWFVQLIGDNGRVLWSSRQPHDDQADGASSENHQTAFGSRVRIRERRVASPGSDVRLIRVGADLTFLLRDLARIDRTAQLTAAIALLVAPLGGYVITLRAIRPLRHLTQVAARLRPGQLDERLPIRNADDELDRLSQTINQLLDRIARHMAQRRDLLANSAHELRSPLAAIRSSIEVVLQTERPLEEYQELLGEIMDEFESLEVLVNQLLLLAETESRQVSWRSEEVDWSRLVEKAVAMFEGVAEHTSVTLEAHVEPDVRVHGHPEHLRHVLNNLLDNALKFTPADGRVTVRLERVPGALAGQDAARLTVSDTGMGIEAEDLERVFERFFRADKARTRTERRGTGLGLCICQAVVAAHRGFIDLTSHPGEGTTVTVLLPIA